MIKTFIGVILDIFSYHFYVSKSKKKNLDIAFVGRKRIYTSSAYISIINQWAILFLNSEVKAFGSFYSHIIYLIG